MRLLPAALAALVVVATLAAPGHAQQRLKRLLGEIEQSVRELKQFRQKMVKQLDRVKSRSQSMPQEELAQLQGKLSLQLKEGGFMGTMSGLLAQANVSRHLTALHRAGILARRKEGVTVYYAIEDEASLEICQSVCARVVEQIKL